MQQNTKKISQTSEIQPVSINDIKNDLKMQEWRDTGETLINQRFNRLVVLDSETKDKTGHLLYRCSCDCGNITFATKTNLLNRTHSSCGCNSHEKMLGKLLNKRFGKLVVISLHEKRGSKNYWLCKCDCGNEGIKETYKLTSGETKSCGCLRNKHNYKDISGNKYGRLTVIKLDHIANNEKKNTYWECLCECGNTKIVNKSNLISGSTQSCDCFRKEKHKEKFVTHGLSKHPLYYTWHDMMDRCYNSNNVSYKHYGGRGIEVCERWHDIDNFIEDVGKKPEGLELDRYPNNNGHYEPNNFRWATRKQQMNNFRRNRWIESNGERKSVQEWSKITGIRPNCILQRLDVYGWTPEEALTLPLQTNNGNTKGRSLVR